MHLQFRQSNSLTMIEKLETIPKLKKALVVEDDSFWRLMIQEALLSNNPSLEIVFTARAEDVVELLSQHKDIELIIADYFLKDSMNGLDLWQTLSAHHSTVPYILLSGIARDEFMRRIIATRMRENPQIIEKPDTLLELSEQLNRALSLYFVSPLADST